MTLSEMRSKCLPTQRRLAAQPPFAQTSTLNTSLTDLLTLQNGLVTIPAGKDILNTYSVDPNYRVGYAQTWNSTIQTDLPRSLVLEVGYLGTKGTRLDIQTLPNRAAPGRLVIGTPAHSDIPPPFGHGDAEREHELQHLRRDRGRAAPGEPDLV